MKGAWYEHANLPCGLRMRRERVESVRIIKLKDVAYEETRQEEAKTSPHPAMEALYRNVHIVTLTQRLQSVQNALLIAELQVLHKAWNTNFFIIVSIMTLNLSICDRKLILRS